MERRSEYSSSNVFPCWTRSTPSSDPIRIRKPKTCATGFLTFARNLFPKKKGLRALQFYPQSGAVFLYPLEGNESIRDRTLQQIMTDPRPNVHEDVRRTFDTRRTSLSDPYEMLRGGMGLVARQALFLNEALLGISVVVMDIPPLLREASLDSPLKNIEIALEDRTGRRFTVGKVFSPSLPSPAAFRSSRGHGDWRPFRPAGGDIPFPAPCFIFE